MWLSCPKGLGKGHRFWIAKVPCESEWVWLGGRSCEMQAELCWEVNLPRLLLFLVVLPISPALPKQLRAWFWVCVLAALFWLTLGCPNLLGSSRSQDRDNRD